MNSHTCEDDMFHLLWEIFKRIGWGRQRFLEEYGLTPSQMEILGALFHLKKLSDDEVTQITLSKKTLIDPMTTSTIIKNLEKKGLLHRVQSKIDSRAVCVNLSEKGTELFLSVVHEADMYKKHLCKRVNIPALREQLKIMLENIKEI